MVFDFAFVLVLLAAVTGIVWGVDSWLFAPRRRERGVARDPVLVDYSRSFFPVIVIVLLLRSFLYEPFRIPSDSMMPTLIQGDFIFVNKWRYGLRLPVVNTKVLEIEHARARRRRRIPQADRAVARVHQAARRAPGRHDPGGRIPGPRERYTVSN